MSEWDNASGEKSSPEDRSVATRLSNSLPRGSKALIFGGVTLAWLCLDMLTKSFFNNSYAVGEVITDSLLGLVRFRLVHNTGAAWGMFGDSTLLLGIFSLVICVVVAAYLFFFSRRTTALEAVGAALVVAGGLGNAIDRLTLGYVVDFIEPVFIDFPVFNVADIGVTCGFILFVLGMFLSYRRLEKEEAASLAEHDVSRGDE